MRSSATLAALALPLAVAVALGPATAHAVLPKCPNVLIVQDRSGSMSSQWAAAKAAVDGILQRNEQSPPTNRIRYGLNMYPGDSNDCTTGVWFVHPAAGSETAIRNAMNASGTPGCTPAAQTFESINTTPQELADGTRPNYIIHVTDGYPNCGDGSCGGNGGEDARVVTAVTSLRTQKNVLTFVVGFTSDVDPAHLNAVAVAGGTPRPGCNPSGGAANPCYYRANNAAELAQALDTIATIIGGAFSGAVTCDESCYGQGCPGEQVCLSATCTTNPCAGVTCQADEFCRSGTCVKACMTPCPPGQKCVDGTCVDDPCASVFCQVELNQVCRNGVCVTDPCVARWDGGANARCRYGQSCLPDGTCGDEPCQYITCPDGTVCVLGQCQSTSAFTPPQVDAAVSPGDGGGRDGSITQGDGAVGDGGHPADGGGLDTGQSACGCHGAGQAGGLVLAFALMVLALGRRRRAG
ncbi:MAG: VWA domain-containing protein [Deltaproteobacteria bacterium]|nr:VWA domain-containing protein [Deltaproteobacteria bacterium]